MNPDKLDNALDKIEQVLEFGTSLSSRIDYLEDELTKLREAIERIENDIRYLKNWIDELNVRR